MLVSVPLFTVTNYIDEPNSYNFGLSLINEFGPESEIGKLIFNDTIEIQSKLATPLIMIYIDPNKTYSSET